MVGPSRSLTPVEQRYSQTEREALAVIWSCEHFNIYIYGQPVTVFTDHKPLVVLFGNPKCRPSPRIERWTLRLQPYDVDIQYRAGHDNPADYMSRHPVKICQSSSREEKIAEEYVTYLAMNAIPKAMTLAEISTATKSDCTLQAVISSLLKTNQTTATNEKGVNISVLNTMHKLRDELSVCYDDTILLRNNRVVIPMSLQLKAVDLAHQGHQGIVKTKALLREKVWFVGIDSMVERRVKSCLACQATVLDMKREPLRMSPLPVAPWTELSTDFAQLSSGEYLLVVIDDYSRFPLVEIVTSTSSAAVIPKLDKIMSEYGIPDILKSDNGPPFSSHEFVQFAEYLGFKHRKITPYWPRG